MVVNIEAALTFLKMFFFSFSFYVLRTGTRTSFVYAYFFIFLLLNGNRRPVKLMFPGLLAVFLFFLFFSVDSSYLSDFVENSPM